MERFISRITWPLMVAAAVVGLWWYLIARFIDGLAKARP